MLFERTVVPPTTRNPPEKDKTPERFVFPEPPTVTPPVDVLVIGPLIVISLVLFCVINAVADPKFNVITLIDAVAGLAPIPELMIPLVTVKTFPAVPVIEPPLTSNESELQA